MIIDALKEFMQCCPLLEEFNVAVGIDNLPEKDDGFAIETVPCEPIKKQYVNGDAVKQYMFNFTSKASYGDDVRQNIENIGFYENFSAWLDACTARNNLPILSAGMTAKKIVAVTTGYIFDAEIDTAKYMIQCRLEYFERGGKKECPEIELWKQVI